MSGDYDLAVMVEGRTMKEVAFFVAEKLAVLDSVVSTTTHFVLKQYKIDGVVLEGEEKDHRQVIVP
jgi:DNA-binding Lrp family transcriptional regulator